MSNLFFTSDQHFGHARMIKFCNRPFKDVEEMDAEMVRRWNAVVETGDTVYHLGDFTLEGYQFAKKMFKQLNGEIHILALTWHHDRRWLPKNWMTSPPMTKDGTFIRKLPPIEVIEVSRHGGAVPMGERPLKITLGHYPMLAWEASYHGAWHLFAHTHGQYQGEGFSLDVGVDSWSFAPVSLDEVRAFMKIREDNK